MQEVGTRENGVKKDMQEVGTRESGVKKDMEEVGTRENGVKKDMQGGRNEREWSEEGHAGR